MSKANSSQRGLTRRSFLKTTAAVAGAATIAGASSPLTALAETQDQGSDPVESVCIGVCRPNCFSYCPLKVHVRDGKVVKISRSDFKDPYYNRVCLRGLSHVARIYDPGRVKYPVRRVGERGEDQWERIAWDEAIDMIVETWNRHRSEFGDRSVVFIGTSGNMGLANGFYFGGFPLLRNLINATGIGTDVDAALTHGVNRVVGNAGQWVGNEPRDMVNAKTIIAWGANITEAQPQEWHCVAEAMEQGVKLVVIDPTFTRLASRADKWVPVRPGSDPALQLSMMQVIVDEGLVDERFLKDHTVAPFLVRSDTKTFLRMSDLGADEAGDPAAVIDSLTGEPASSQSCSEPDLRAETVVNGIACTTAYNLLLEEVSQYPPDVAEGITEVPAETIIELARIAADGPVTHRVGFGPQAYTNGVHAAHAGMTLCALTGNIGYPGASYGANWQMLTSFNFDLLRPTGASTSKSIPILVLPEVMRTGTFMGEDYPLKSAMIYCTNPVSTRVGATEFLEDFIMKLEFVVVADTMFTDTARYADIVLPAAHWFEVEDVIAAGQSHYAEISEKAVDPLYEAKSDLDMARLLCAKLGFNGVIPDTDEEYLRQVLDCPSCANLGISYDALKREKQIRYFSEEQNPFIAWAGNKFLTPSGRMEFYLENPKTREDYGQDIDVDRERLPRFFPPDEAWLDDPLYEKYPFVLLSERPKFRVHSQWFSTEWLRELDPEPIVKINPADAAAKGIADGDYVEVLNDRGHCVAKAVFSEAVRRGTLIYPKNWQRNQHVEGSWSELMNPAFDPVGMNQSFMDNLADVRPWAQEG